jgi:hypothetical protein
MRKQHPVIRDEKLNASLFSRLRPGVIILITGDIFLLPVSETNFQHPDARPRAAEAVFGIGWNPELITGFGVGNGFTHLNYRSVI